MERPLPFIVAALCAASALSGIACSRKDAAPPSHIEEREPPPKSSPPEHAAAHEPDTRPIIVAFGDSLTAGVAVGKSYPDYLQDLLSQNNYNYRVDNQGVSGDTTTDGLARIDNVIAVHPALVVLEFGGNDGLRGIPVEATQKNLEEMISRIQTAKLRLVLLGITLPPNYGPDYVKPFTAMFPTIAKKYKVNLFPFLLANVYRDPGLMQPDGIHPNEKGNQIVAQDVFRLIKPSLTPPAGKQPRPN